MLLFIHMDLVKTEVSKHYLRMAKPRGISFPFHSSKTPVDQIWGFSEILSEEWNWHTFKPFCIDTNTHLKASVLKDAQWIHSSFSDPEIKPVTNPGVLASLTYHSFLLQAELPPFLFAGTAAVPLTATQWTWDLASENVHGCGEVAGKVSHFECGCV